LIKERKNIAILKIWKSVRLNKTTELSARQTSIKNLFMEYSRRYKKNISPALWGFS
jgi:hypothetical protein